MSQSGSRDSIRNQFPWLALLERSTKPIFILQSSRRIRYVNPAWESATKCSAEDAYGRACVRSGRIDPLFRTFAPPPQARDGRLTRIRRAAPLAKGGPPWWDLTFIPFPDIEGVQGYLGTLEIVQPTPPIPPRKQSPAVAQFREVIAERYRQELFAGEESLMRKLRGQLRLAAQTQEPVWITGGAGAGKETAARVIHHHSAVREKAIVACDGKGVPGYLIDSILFGIGGIATAGHVGTLVIKNPECLPRDAQQRILDWLKIAPNPPRLINTSRYRAAECVASGTLINEYEADYSTFEITIPNLIDRTESWDQIVSRLPFNSMPELMETLRRCLWPGNIRELIETLHEASEVAGENQIGSEHLPRHYRERIFISENPKPLPEKSVSLDQVLEEVEKRMILMALRKARGNQTEAATALGIARARLGRRIEALGIDKSPTSST